MRAPERASRRRTEPRRSVRGRTETFSLEKALDILDLLAGHPAGLTILEIAARLRCPAPEIIGAIAIMQRRQWLRTGGLGAAVTLGERVTALVAGR